MVFILITLDKIHYARGPDIFSKPDEIVDKRRQVLPALSITEVEHGGALSSSQMTVPTVLVICDDDPERMGDASSEVLQDEKSTSLDKPTSLSHCSEGM